MGFCLADLEELVDLEELIDLEEATIQNNTREHYPMLDNITQLVVYKHIMPTHKQAKLSPALEQQQGLAWHSQQHTIWSDNIGQVQT